MGENMKTETEIKVGQIYVTKASKEPVIIHEVGDYFVTWRWYKQNGAMDFIKDIFFTFRKTFEFVAESMSEEDFKQWCMTGKKPALKAINKIIIKDDEIIYQSSPIGKKHDNNKPRFSLLPSQIWQVIDVLEFGAKRYGIDNWQQVDNAKERYFNACHRHLQAWWSGERLDSESGLPHLAHAVCCLLFLMWGDDELAKVHD